MEKITERTGLYHEHQEGALCGQHALNNLLQGPMFTADTLADIARQLDADEKTVLTNASDLSENVDDTGFFNIQVLQLALKMFDIELVPLASQEPIAQQARSRPDSIQAYICNLGLHWFAIRRFGRQYFNLNSMYYVPLLTSPEELSINLKIIEENGYPVFIVSGNLPQCLADQQLAANPISPAEFRLLTKDMPKLIMNGETIGNTIVGYRNGKAVFRLPTELYYEYQKNPNDPRVREMINAKLPKGMILDDFIETDVTCNDPNCHLHGKQNQKKTIPTARTPERQVTEQPTRRETPSDYGSIQDQPGIPNSLKQRVPHPSEEMVFDNSDVEKITETVPPISQTRSRQMAQIIVTGTESIIPNAASAQRANTRRLLILSQLTRGDPASADDPNAPQMNPSSQDMVSEEELLVRDVMALSLLREKLKENEAHISQIRSTADELEQLLARRVLAVGLFTNASETARVEQPPEVIPITTMNSEPVTIKMPSSSTALSPPSPNTNSSSLTDTHPPSSSTPSSPPANIPLPQSTNTYLPSSTNTFLLPSTSTNGTAPAATSSPPSMATNTSAPVTTNLPPPTITATTPSKSVTTNAATLVLKNPPPSTTTSLPSPTATSSSTSALPRSDSTESPTVEELRERRLKTYGNRDRSIISAQSNFDD